MPRLLQRNERAIAEARGGAERARLLAQRVILLARHWRAADVPDALRAAEAAAASAADRLADTELALARGVAMYYGAQVGLSLETIRAAGEAAAVLGHAGLEAECEAWIGCVRGTLHHTPAEVLPHLHRAVQLGQTHRPLAAARALYVLATLYQEADLVDEAMRHYRRASTIARSGNDEQLVAAVHRYMALAQAQQMRRARAAGRLDAEQLRQSLAGLGSAQHLATALTSDDAGLQSQLRLGEMLRLAGEHAQAVEAFERCVDAAAQAGMTWEATIARADHAACLAHCGRLADAARHGALAEAELAPDFDDYARAVVHDSLAELAAVIGLPAREAQHREASRRAWEADASYCAGLRAALLERGPLVR